MLSFGGSNVHLESESTLLDPDSPSPQLPAVSLSLYLIASICSTDRNFVLSKFFSGRCTLFTPKVPFSILCTRLSLVDRQGFMHPLLKWFWLTGLVSAQGSLGASCICWRSLESLIMDTFKSLHLSFPGHIILTDASSLGYVGCAHCFNIRELIFCFTCLGVSIMVWIPQCTSPVVVSLWRQWLLPPRLIGQPLLRNLLTSWFRQIMALWKLMLQKVFDQWFY